MGNPEGFVMQTELLLYVEGTCSSLKESSQTFHSGFSRLLHCVDAGDNLSQFFNYLSFSFKSRSTECSRSYQRLQMQHWHRVSISHFTLFNIESVVKSVTGSVIDLDFLRTKVLEKHEEEIVSMGFVTLVTPNLETLPWSNLDLKVLNLTRGSTILDFRVEFKEPPRNNGDVNVYRLMELFILSAVENIPGWQMLRERRSPKGQGLLRKEGPPTYAILSQNSVFSRFTHFLKDFHRALNESHPAFVELSTKAILLS